MAWKDEHGLADCHSDKKLRSDLNCPESSKMSELRLKTLRQSGDFQAEYEGSIPFTRSKRFREPGFIRFGASHACGRRARTAASDERCGEMMRRTEHTTPSNSP
jgi:hypothetical protein